MLIESFAPNISHVEPKLLALHIAKDEYKPAQIPAYSKELHFARLTPAQAIGLLGINNHFPTLADNEIRHFNEENKENKDKGKEKQNNDLVQDWEVERDNLRIDLDRQREERNKSNQSGSPSPTPPPSS